MPLDLLTDAYAIYDCSSFGNDTEGNLIWASRKPDLDLTKGDGTTAGTFPTFVDAVGGYYTFDGVNDYISNWAIPAGYFVSACFSTSYPDGQPYVTQVTDSTVEDLLTVSGAFTGNLHSILVWEEEPAALDKITIANFQMRMLWRDTWVDPWVSRMIRRGLCVLWADFEHPENLFNDYAGVSTFTNNGFTWDHGLLRSDQYSYVSAPDSIDLRFGSIVSMFFSGDFQSIAAGYAGLIGKANEYYMYLNRSGDNIVVTANGINSASIPLPRLSLAVVLVEGSGPKYYVDGELADTAASPVTVNAGSGTMYIGNVNPLSLSDAFDAAIYRAGVFDARLTDEEVRLLHYSADLGNVLATDTIRATILNVGGDDQLDPGQTNVVIACRRAGAIEGKVYLTDTSIFDEATVVVEQPIDSWANESIQFDLDSTGIY